MTPTLTLVSGGLDVEDTTAAPPALGFPPGWTVERKGSGWLALRSYIPGRRNPARLFGDDLDELRRIACGLSLRCA